MLTGVLLMLTKQKKGIVMSIPLTLIPVTAFGILTPFAFKVSEHVYLLKNQI